MSSPAPQERPTPSSDERPVYEPPRIITYDENALLKLIGPAIACARWVKGSSPDDEEDL